MWDNVGEPGLPFSPFASRVEAGPEGSHLMMAIDDLLDRGRDARRRRDDAAAELAAVVKALDGLAGVDMLDPTQRRELTKLRDRPRAKRRRTSASTSTSS